MRLKRTQDACTLVISVVLTFMSVLTGMAHADDWPSASSVTDDAATTTAVSMYDSAPNLASTTVVGAGGLRAPESPVADASGPSLAFLGELDAPRGRANFIDEGAHRLIGANRAQIDPRKLTEYALNPSHPVGANKARVFESAFGFTRANADDLLAQLRHGVMNNNPVPGVVDKFGTRFAVDIPVTGPSGSGLVRTGWIYDPGSLTPRLTTLYVP